VLICRLLLSQKRRRPCFQLKTYHAQILRALALVAAHVLDRRLAFGDLVDLSFELRVVLFPTGEIRSEAKLDLAFLE